MKIKCDICNGKGFIDTVSYGSRFVKDNTTIIEKCDDCNIFYNDDIASQYALKNYNVFTMKNEYGVNVKIDFYLN